MKGIFGKNFMMAFRIVFACFLILSVMASCSKNGGTKENGDENKETTFTTTVYDAGQDDHIYFRIPAMVETTSNTILAFCEARNTYVDFCDWYPDLFPEYAGSGDSGNIDLVLKRSTDGGKTWGDLIYVADDRDNTCGNPVPVVDPETGRIHLFWCWQQYPTSSLSSDIYPSLPDSHTRRVMYCYSDDDGLTWSEYQDMTSTLKSSDWTWYATGPNHGIIKTLEPYKGRIIIPANHRDATNTLNYSHDLYSDDKGATWHLGGSTGLGGNESCAAELEDGNVLLNMRIHGSTVTGGCRAYSITTDGGDTWGDFIRNEELVDPGCQGSIINYFVDGKPSNILLLSNVHNVSTRRNISISVSEDSGQTWTTPYIYCTTLGAYSDILQLSDGSLCMLYENGVGEFGSARYYERISFFKIPLSLIHDYIGI